jgi:hypothetical protein
MTRAVFRMLSWKAVRLIGGFCVFVIVLSTARNLFFPVIEPFGYGATPTWKLVFGIPTFFVPNDFSGCTVLGARVHPLALAINVATYLAVAAVIPRIGLFCKRHV